MLVKTQEEQPGHSRHWSTRSTAAELGMSQSAVSRIWRAYVLKPHVLKQFRHSTDPQVIDKVRD